MKYWAWTGQRITRSGNCGPVFRTRKLCGVSLHSSPPPDQGQREIPSTGRAFPSTTTYGAHRNGRARASASVPCQNAAPFGVSRTGALAKSKREEAHSSSQAVGFTLLGPSERRPNRAAAYQGLTRSRPVTPTPQLRNEIARPPHAPGSLQRRPSAHGSSATDPATRTANPRLWACNVTPASRAESRRPRPEAGARPTAGAA